MGFAGMALGAMALGPAAEGIGGMGGMEDIGGIEDIPDVGVLI